MSFPACSHARRRQSATQLWCWLAVEPYRVFFFSGAVRSSATSFFIFRFRLSLRLALPAACGRLAKVGPLKQARAFNLMDFQVLNRHVFADLSTARCHD